MKWIGVPLTTFALVLALAAGDWPQWRGPQRDGVSPETIAPWKGPLPVLWRQPVGEGHSSPVVAAGRVYVHAKVKDRDREELIALDAASGKELWRQGYDRAPYTNIYGNGPRATPLVDGDRVYTLGVTGILACWSTSDGRERWKLDLLKEYGAANLFFGVSTTPVLDGDRLLVLAGGPEASIVCLDKHTGKNLWKSGSDKASYASPIITTQGDKRLALFLTHQGVAALDPADGRRYWHFPLVDKLAESSTTPVRYGDMVFASSVTTGGYGLRLTLADGKPAFQEVWKNPALSCYFSTPVAVDGHLYVVTGRIVPAAATLHCVEGGTGKVLWSRPKVGKYHATVMKAGSRILMLEEEGNLVLIEPDSKEYRELARAKVCGHSWCHPALAEGRLVIRDDRELLALATKGE